MKKGLITGYFEVYRWSQAFAYRKPIGLGPFIAEGLITLAAALHSIIYQTLKAALANPVHSLRYE